MSFRSVLLPLTSALTLLECTRQGSGVTAYARVSDVSIPADTNGAWP